MDKGGPNAHFYGVSLPAGGDKQRRQPREVHGTWKVMRTTEKESRVRGTGTRWLHSQQGGRGGPPEEVTLGGALERGDQADA